MPSLVEALEQKYGKDCEGSSTETEISEDEGIAVAIYVPKKSPRALIPSLLVLNDCDITSAGEQEVLVSKCACVEELDLAKNKLENWPEIVGILQQMPKLRFVNLSFNNLTMPLEELGTTIRWNNMRNLVLNATFISWESVQKLLEHLPQLDELHLSLNDYSNVELQTGKDKNKEVQPEETKEDDNNKAKKYPTIKKLHFTGNLVTQWDEICKLGQAFPNLESLVLAECPISSLEVSKTSEGNQDSKIVEEKEEATTQGSPHDSFSNLRVLNLNSTQITSWEDIERLSKFPNLTSLRVQGCPLWENSGYTEHERRQLLIARLPKVRMLNGGGPIEFQEREDAERAFIRYYMDKAESNRPVRYTELVEIHGQLDPLVKPDMSPEKEVKMKIKYGPKSEVRTIDVYKTVNELKSDLESFAGFSPNKMRLFYVDQDLHDIQGPEEMKYPNKQLYSYNIRSGDEILVDYKRNLKED